MINGKLIPLNSEAKYKINQLEIKQGASLIYALNENHFQVEGLEKYEGLDYSFLEDYYEKALECIPHELQTYLKERLNIFSKPMEYDLSEFKWENNEKNRFCY